jgi:hypothetical protein
LFLRLAPLPPPQFRLPAPGNSSKPVVKAVPL